MKNTIKNTTAARPGMSAWTKVRLNLLVLCAVTGYFGNKEFQRHIDDFEQGVEYGMRFQVVEQVATINLPKPSKDVISAEKLTDIYNESGAKIEYTDQIPKYSPAEEAKLEAIYAQAAKR